MENEILKINILSIAICGVVMANSGIALLYFKDSLAPYMRYVMPIPPISVAAYVYVFNMYRKDGIESLTLNALLGDALLAALTTAMLFLVFSATIGHIHRSTKCGTISVMMR